MTLAIASIFYFVDIANIFLAQNLERVTFSLIVNLLHSG